MLTLSDAIRLGAMLRPQGFGWFSSAGGTCAIGAAAEAVGGVHHVSASRWPVLALPFVRCPACHYEWTTSGIAHAGSAAIVHLNDEHKWTREQIAEWVATLEPQDVPSERTPDADTVTV